VKIIDYIKLTKEILLEKYLGYLFAVVVFSLAFYMQYSVAFYGLDLHHDLLMFDAARNFYSGQIPYKDFFYQYNLGTVSLHAATLGILGLKIVALKKVTVLFYALIALLIYLSCALEGHKRSGLLLSILWASLSPFYMPAMNGYHAWSTVYMMFSCMAGLFFFQLAMRKNPIVFSLFAGMFFSFGFWFKQVAAFQIIAVVIWLVLHIGLSFSSKVDRVKYIKIFSGYAIGGILASIPFIGYLYLESAIFDWWNNAFEFNKYFASDSQNANGFYAFLKILFPISRNLGHNTFFWALSPFILCVVAVQVFIFRDTILGSLKSNKEVLGLFIFAGVACWFGYFPLPHQFHTQFFMAPTFVLIGLMLGKYPLSFVGTRKYVVVFLAIYIFLISAIYETYYQFEGWNNKRFAYKQNSIEINLNSSFDGLKIDSSTEKALSRFYKSLLELEAANKNSEFIPLSVDPLRGLLPGKITNPSKFKMGVDWTWPNELVEPGFSDLKNNQIMKHQQPIYADSLIYIPGYRPIAILEMIAPISSYHTLYKPNAEVSKLIERVEKSNQILFITDKDFDPISRSMLFSWSTEQKLLNMIPFKGITADELKGVKNINISIIEETDFPDHLSALQIEYLKKEEKYYRGNLMGLFSIDNRGVGFLRGDLNLEEKKSLAFFMLSTGKLFTNQNRPIYATTFSKITSDRPFMLEVVTTEGDSSLGILKSKINDQPVRINQAIYEKVPASIYLVTKPLMRKEGSKFIVLQIELQNSQMKNYFYSFIDDAN